MPHRAPKLRVREKVGFSLGDIGCNFVFNTLIVFQAGFYTDVMGISAAALGMLLFVVRFSDAITDPIMGTICDRTNHRWGKFRPWLLWSAIPFAGLAWLTFTVPSGGDGFRLVYAYLTYGLLMVAYTVNNVPYGALNAVITGDLKERTSLSQYRFVGVTVAALIVQGLTLPLVGKFGGGDDAKGWSATMGIYGLIAIGLFVVTFFSVKERVNPPRGQKANLRQDFKDMFRNGAWLAMAAMSVFLFTMLALRGGANYYYFTYFVDHPALSSFLDRFGLFATQAQVEARSGWFVLLDTFGLIVREGTSPTRVGFSLFNVFTSLMGLIGVFFAQPLATHLGKKLSFGLAMAIGTVFQAGFFFLSPADVGFMFLFSTLGGLAYASAVPLVWAMMADMADYGEWRHGRRATGFLYAAMGFMVKAGMGFGGAFLGMILASYGYTVETATAGVPEVLYGIKMCVGVYSALPMGLAVVCVCFYPISKALNIRMSNELFERRAKGSASVPESSL